jgi:Putative Actinobacterial Holin-X, holin superfamily III
MTETTQREDLRGVPVGELVERLSTQLSTLVRDEMELAAAELRRKGSQAGVGAGLSGAAAVVAWFGAGALVAAAILGLATVLPAWLSALIIGLLLLAVAAVLAVTGAGRIKQAVPPVPEQAISGAKADVETVKRGLHR